MTQFSLKETSTAASDFSFGPFRLLPAERQLLRDGRPVAVTPKALDLLCLLVQNRGHVLSKDEIMSRLWPGAFVEEGNLVQHISVLRKTLGQTADCPYIETVARFGYRFWGGPEVTAADAPALSTPPSAPSVAAAVTPVTHYARSGDVNIAYQVLGDGPIDLVFVMGWVSHLEYFWREPHFARFLQHLASFARLIVFDKRGTGLSDRVPVTALPTLEERMDDVRAVMEAVGSESAVIMGVSEGGPLSALFAATYPERTRALVMIGSYAKRQRGRGYPWGPTSEERDRFLEEIRTDWGGPIGIAARAPSLAQDPAFREWWATYLRMGASPGAAIALTRMNSEIDVRRVLPAINVPTLVLHRSGDQCLLVEEGRYLASMIPGARFVELPGADHLPFVGRQDEILNAVEEFLIEVGDPREGGRILATVLAFDGDPVPQPELERALRLFRGEHVGRYGVFDGPARAIRCARMLALRAVESGLQLRVALHTGECHRSGAEPLSGAAVEIVEQLLLATPPGQVIVSSTVRDLVAGSGLRFSRLSDIPVETSHGPWRLYQVADTGRHVNATG
ncbi:MAG: alpha/beta fold hydrolase [Acidobacteria bacterium]|nr:alpha/beta fold hydrolase [Acidobacteriota bacterium]